MKYDSIKLLGGNIMDFFDTALGKAKDAFDIVSKKTSEVVATGKQKFDIASLENKRSKDFAALGEIYYNLIKDSEIQDIATKELVEEIKDKSEKIAIAKQEISNAKNKRYCPKCSAEIEEGGVFCSVCGAKIDE